MLNKDIKLKEQSNYSSSNFQNKFIVTRILGHPELRREYEGWREVNDWWIWSKHSYYIIFYSRSLWDLYFHEFDLTDPNYKQISNLVYKTNKEILNPSSEDDAISFDAPYISGSFNSWKLERMYSLQEAWKIFDKSKSIEVPEALSKPEYKRSK